VAPNDLSGDLISNLDPASSVSAAEGHSPQRQPEDKIRRRSRPQEESSENDSLTDDSQSAEHKIDRLA
jgi:hypothetical protein